MNGILVVPIRIVIEIVAVPVEVSLLVRCRVVSIIQVVVRQKVLPKRLVSPSVPKVDVFPNSDARPSGVSVLFCSFYRLPVGPFSSYSLILKRQAVVLIVSVSVTLLLPEVPILLPSLGVLIPCLVLHGASKLFPPNKIKFYNHRNNSNLIH